MFDSTSVKAAELLSYFGRNTCVTVAHDYGSKEMFVKSARTGNVIATVVLSNTLAYEYVDYSRVENTFKVHPENMLVVACAIQELKKFPKNRKMNRTWSPIRLTARAEADREVTRATIAWSAE